MIPIIPTSTGLKRIESFRCVLRPGLVIAMIRKGATMLLRFLERVWRFLAWFFLPEKPAPVVRKRRRQATTKPLTVHFPGGKSIKLTAAESKRINRASDAHAAVLVRQHFRGNGRGRRIV